MKTLKTIFIMLFTLTIVNAGYSQVGANYKQPYSGSAQTTLKKENHNSFELSTTSHNYKRPDYKAHIIQEGNNLICCSGKPENVFFSVLNYKQPYSRSLENSCLQGLVRNGKAPLACCKN
jgi:hypothetical protein